MFRIGPITADPGILLAPMEDVSELPFRLICRELGADIVYTEFVNAEGLLREDPNGPRRAFRKLRFAEASGPWRSSSTARLRCLWRKPLRSPAHSIQTSSTSTAAAG